MQTKTAGFLFEHRARVRRLQRRARIEPTLRRQLYVRPLHARSWARTQGTPVLPGDSERRIAQKRIDRVDGAPGHDGQRLIELAPDRSQRVGETGWHDDGVRRRRE